jgi:hypothetical protein
VRSKGIKAYCSDLIVDQDRETVCFLSICGYQVAVKGIIANFLGDNGIALETNGFDHYLRCSHLSYKVQLKKLPSGLVHAVAILKLALPSIDDGTRNSFLVITKDDRETRPLFFRHLDEKTELPLHPSWTEWLWNTFDQQEDWLLEQTTLAGDFKGYLFKFNPEYLKDLISEAIREKMPKIISCLTYERGNGDGTIDRA